VVMTTNYQSFQSPMPEIKIQKLMATPPTIEKETRKTANEDKSPMKNHSIPCLDTTSVYEGSLKGAESTKGNTQLIQLKSASKLAKQYEQNQQDFDYGYGQQQMDHSPLKYSDLGEIKEEPEPSRILNNNVDIHIYKSIEIKENRTISPLKPIGVNVISDNDLVNRILENRSISVTGLNQGKTRENWSKEIHNQLDTIRENIWQKKTD